MSVTLPQVILRGTLASRPAANSAGSLYFASDTGKQYRDNGISWDDVTPPGVVQGPAGAVGPAGPSGPAGPAGQDGAPGVPGYSPNSLQAGGGVVWTSGLSFTVSPATYLIGNVAYTSPQTSVTLGAAHASLDRIDVIAVDSSGTAVVIAGTASSTPSMPAVDPSTQLQLSWAYVAASATTPSNITTDDIYHENTEWTSTKSGSNINLASTSSPIAGTVSVQATAAATGNYAQFQSPSPFDPATRNALKFTIQNQVAWPATRSLQIMLLNAGAQRGSIVVLSSGAFGFSTSDISSNQQVVIPIALFAASGLSVNQVRFTVSGTGTAMSFKLDDIILQSGVVPASAPTGMTWSGAWNATKTYPVNATVSYGGSSWVSMAANTNSAPTATNANWAQMTVAQPYLLAAAFSGGGIALTAGSSAGVSLVYCVPVARACTAFAWTVTVDQGSAGFRVWRIAAGTAVPTVANTITSADLAISSGTNLKSTTFTNFTGSVAPTFAVGDIVAIQLKASASATYAAFSLECQ